MSGAISNGSLQPTWFGHVQSAKDALILFEACLNGTLHHVPRRPHDRERSHLIKSGCVFIYEENASGIKRWTDGVPWSPSRILGNFLVYRELSKPFPPGEKKRATKKNARPARAARGAEPYTRTNSTGSPPSPTTPKQQPEPSPEDRERERLLIGSLVDSYGFKEGGLVKKTMSVTVNGVQHHLVSYYTMDDAASSDRLPQVSSDPRLINIEPRQELVTRQIFRAPIDDITADTDAFMHPGGLPYPSTNYGIISHHADNIGHMSMGYTSMPLSSANFTSSIQSYAPTHGVSPSFYHPGTGMPAATSRQESYSALGNNGYGIPRPPNLSITTDRRSSFPQQSQYAYPGVTPPHLSRPTLGGPMPQAQDSRPLDSHYWDRSVTSATHGNIYTTTSTSQPQSAGPYSAHNTHWSMPASALPRLETAWPSADSNWNGDNGRHGSFQAAAQLNL